MGKLIIANKPNTKANLVFMPMINAKVNSSMPIHPKTASSHFPVLLPKFLVLAISPSIQSQRIEMNARIEPIIKF